MRPQRGSVELAKPLVAFQKPAQLRAALAAWSGQHEPQVLHGRPAHHVVEIDEDETRVRAVDDVAPVAVPVDALDRAHLEMRRDAAQSVGAQRAKLIHARRVDQRIAEKLFHECGGERGGRAGHAMRRLAPPPTAWHRPSSEPSRIRSSWDSGSKVRPPVRLKSANDKLLPAFFSAGDDRLKGAAVRTGHRRDDRDLRSRRSRGGIGALPLWPHGSTARVDRISPQAVRRSPPAQPYTRLT